MEFEIGDRIIFNGLRCLIIEIAPVHKMFFVRDLDRFWVGGNNQEYWINMNYVELDKQYYREINLRKLGIE